MSETDGAIAARKRANLLFQEAVRKETETGVLDGVAYKVAANAYRAAMLLELNSARIRGRRNTGSSGSTTDDKIQFLREIVQADHIALNPNKKKLNPSSLAALVAEDYMIDALSYWTDLGEYATSEIAKEKLEKAVFNFAGRKERKNRIFGDLGLS